MDILSILFSAEGLTLNSCIFLRIGGRIGSDGGCGVGRRLCLRIRRRFTARQTGRRGIRTGVGRHPDGCRAPAHDRRFSPVAGCLASMVRGAGCAGGGSGCDSQESDSFTAALRSSIRPGRRRCRRPGPVHRLADSPYRVLHGAGRFPARLLQHRHGLRAREGPRADRGRHIPARFAQQRRHTAHVPLRDAGDGGADLPLVRAASPPFDVRGCAAAADRRRGGVCRNCCPVPESSPAPERLSSSPPALDPDVGQPLLGKVGTAVVECGLVFRAVARSDDWRVRAVGHPLE